MRFSESWLRDCVSPAPQLDTRQLADRLTMLGLEVDSIESAGQVDTHVVAAEIMAITPMSAAPSPLLCELDIGTRRLRVVCAAPNLRVGMKVACAQVGAEIVSGVVSAREIQGRQSQGMLVSELELGLSETGDVIIELDDHVTPGTSLQRALNLDDACISLDLTPDRGDCQGVLGIARDLAASLGAEVVWPSFTEPRGEIQDECPVAVEAPQACARFLAAICREMQAGCSSPAWLRERLRRSGLRSIHPAVDITNYVMLELGRPLHAYDLDKIRGGIRVRFGDASEQLMLLNGKQISLDGETLAICDHQGPLGLAGIMGDASSGVTAETRSLLLECAWFNPRLLGRSARRLGLHTDASLRFERGVDPESMQHGMDRARQLVAEITGARLGPVTLRESVQNLPRRSAITLRQAQVRRLTGENIKPTFVSDGLRRLQFEVKEASQDSWSVTAPAHRFDIEGEADLVEEVARLHGFERIPSVPSGGIRAARELARPSRVVREFLAAQGYHEVISYSFLPQSLVEMLPGVSAPVSLQNPMSSDQAVMRSSLVPGLLRTLTHNLSRQHSRTRLFEVGRVFLAPDANMEHQPLRVAAVHCGSLWPESWNQDARDVDFFDLKGDVERLLEEICGVGAQTSTQTGTQIRWLRSTHALCHPGRGARLLLDGCDAGVVAQLHPDAADALQIEHPVCYFELDCEVLTRRQAGTFVEPSRFPRVRRDLAVLVNRDLEAAEIEHAVRAAADEILCDFGVFDVYSGPGIAEREKSIAIRLLFQSRTRTLKDEEVSGRVALIVDALRTHCGATLRGALA